MIVNCKASVDKMHPSRGNLKQRHACNAHEDDVSGHNPQSSTCTFTVNNHHNNRLPKQTRAHTQRIPFQMLTRTALWIVLVTGSFKPLLASTVPYVDID